MRPPIAGRGSCRLDACQTARQAGHACTAAVFGLKVEIMLSSDPKLLSIALRRSPLGGSNSCSTSRSYHFPQRAHA